MSKFSGYVPEPSHHGQPISQTALVQQAGQVPYMDQGMSHENKTQSDGSLPGPRQTLNTQSKKCYSLLPEW